MCWCKSEGLTFQQFWTWCKLKLDTESREYRYNEYWNKCNWTTPESLIDTLLFKFYPKLKLDKSKERYLNLNKIVPTNIITDAYMKSQYIGESKYTFLDIRMGGNKTGAILDYIKQSGYKRILFISPRVALSKDILGRMTTIGLEFCLYIGFRIA